MLRRARVMTIQIDKRTRDWQVVGSKYRILIIINNINTYSYCNIHSDVSVVTYSGIDCCRSIIQSCVNGSTFIDNLIMKLITYCDINCLLIDSVKLYHKKSIVKTIWNKIFKKKFIIHYLLEYLLSLLRCDTDPAVNSRPNENMRGENHLNRGKCNTEHESRGVAVQKSKTELSNLYKT